MVNFLDSAVQSEKSKSSTLHLRFTCKKNFNYLFISVAINPRVRSLSIEEQHGGEFNAKARQQCN